MKNSTSLLRKNIQFTLAILLLFFSCSDDSSNDTNTIVSDTNTIVSLKSEFASNLNKIIEGKRISFTEKSEGEPTSWSWTFEGGTPAKSTEKNPVISYSEQGTFKVSLTVSKDDDSETIEKENLIDVLALFDENEVPETQLCKLDKIFTNDYVDIGFPNNGPSSSLGQVNIQVLFVDFPDAVASQTTTSIFNLLENINTEFYEEMSYGKMGINLLPYHSWLRLSMVSSQYAESLNSSSGHLSFIQEAVDLADDQVDFSDTDIVLVMSNPDASEIEYGPTFGSLNDSFAINADGNSILTGITSGFDFNYWGGIWLAHEMGHSLGLLDLYAYSNSNNHRYVGGFGVMGIQSGRAPGFFAYERWLLGWIDDSQIYCHSEGSITIEIQELATEGGIKALSVPLNSNKAILIESRKKKGFDSSMQKEGALVYVIDTSIPRGQGPLRILQNSNTGSMKENAPMIAGDIYTYEGVTIEVIESKSSSDIIQVTLQ